MAEQTPEKKSWAEISEQIRRLFGGGRATKREGRRPRTVRTGRVMQMKIVMRYTHAERIKWVRLMSKIRNMSRTTGINATIRTRRLADGSREGEISW